MNGLRVVPFVDRALVTGWVGVVSITSVIDVYSLKRSLRAYHLFLQIISRCREQHLSKIIREVVLLMRLAEASQFMSPKSARFNKVSLASLWNAKSLLMMGSTGTRFPDPTVKRSRVMIPTSGHVWNDMWDSTNIPTQDTPMGTSLWQWYDHVHQPRLRD